VVASFQHLDRLSTTASKGSAPTEYRLGVLARASQKQVVNVAQRGGMCAVMIGRASKRVAGL